MLPDLHHFTVTEHDAVVVATLDVPGRNMNVIDSTVLSELRRIVDAVLADDRASGMVLVSGKVGSFGGGADLNSLPGLADDPQTVEFLTRTHGLMTSMAEASKPIVVGIDGYALGGALEVALGGSTVLVTGRSRLGLPEATLGLIPGGGGTQLIFGRVDAAVATELMVSGRSLPAEDAVGIGLADHLVDDPGALLPRAIELARQPISRRSHPAPDALAAEAAVAAGEAVRRPPSKASQTALIDTVRTGLTRGLAAGLAAEREHFLRLLKSEESAALVHLFHVETDAKRRFRDAGTRPSKVAVVGAGQMGAGIAATAVRHGVPAAVRDVDRARIDEAGARAAEATNGPATARWTGTTEWDGFADADVVVEAVFERPDLKRETLGLLDDRVGADTLRTTNTSAIPIADLAGAVSRPDWFLGTHFFSPVERMPLVELVPHASTHADAVSRAGGMARALGKVPVVVADRPGFFTSRVYARWLIEGLRLLLDGADPALIEQEARHAGFPVGPLQACDEVTLELVLQASVTQVAERVLTGRVDVPAVKRLLGRMIDSGRCGKRFGKGFYAYTDGRRAGLDPAVTELAGQDAGVVAAGEAGERLLLAFVTESMLCWDDATLCHPDDGDLAAVLGIGFPRPLGGPFHWVDRQGAAVALKRVRRQDATAFPVGDTLPRLAATDAAFGSLPRRERPGSP